MSGLLALVVVFVCGHTPQYKKWLALLQRDKVMKWSARYRIELGLPSGHQNLTVYRHCKTKIK